MTSSAARGFRLPRQPSHLSIDLGRIGRPCTILCLGAGQAAIFREVVIPGALPAILTGLSVGMGVSWLCLISAEMISGQFGIGYFTWVAYGIVKYSQIVVGMLVIGVLGMLSSALIRLIGARCMPWLPRR